MQLCVAELEEGQAREVQELVAADEDTSAEVVQQSLRDLGYNDVGDIVFTRCDVINRRLTTIDALNGFPFLQRVCVDGNHLTNLDPLADHRGLVHVSARRNRLDESVFRDLLSSASTLEHLHLDGNQLTSLRGLSCFPYLMDFSASNNRITSVHAEDLEGLSGLMRVQLAENQLTHIDPFAFTGAPDVRQLQLSQNSIQDISFASYLSSNLDTLLLAGNQVSVVGESLSGCQALTTLDLSLNNIESLSTLEGLRGVTSLSVLTISGNPCMRDESGATAARSGAFSVSATEEDGASRPLSRSEIVMDDPTTSGAAVPLANAHIASLDADLDDSDLETAHYRELSVVPPTDDVHDYAALAAPVTHGLVRHVVAAPREVTIPWSIDATASVQSLPSSQRNTLRLLHWFPQLASLNGRPVTPEQVAHAAYMFNEHSATSARAEHRS